MENKQLLDKISEMRKNFVADRVRDKQDQAYVEEKGRALLSLNRSGNRVVMSGDKVRLRKIQEADPVIMKYQRNLFLEPEEDTEMEFGTDENRDDPKKFIPKLFCQVGDKRNGWHSKNFATLLLTIFSGGQGGKLFISDKTSPKPAWFNGSWLTYINPATAPIEANTDVIVGIFEYFNLDPKFHNLKPANEEVEEGEVGGGEELDGREVGEVRLNQQGLEQQGLGEHELDQQGQLDNIPVVYQVPVNTDEHAEEHQENNKEPQQENMEEQNRKEIEMEVDEEVDDQEKTENSLNLNLSSVSDAENEGTIDDGRQQVVDNGKKRFNLFENLGKKIVVKI